MSKHEHYSKLLDWRLHLVVIIVTILAEIIGIMKFDIGIGIVILLPLLYAFLFSVLFNGNIIPGTGRIIGPSAQTASHWVLICVMPFIAKFSIGIGPKINDIIAAGPALILQELGNVATVLVAMPVAVLLFRMGRESVGATHSIAREPNIALVADRFGIKSPEGIGVMGVYVMGTLFGAIYFSLLAGFMASWDYFDVRALAMACGVGSGSMMGACSASLAEVVPDRAEDIVAFAATSNLLTYGTGLFVSVFVALPLAEYCYKFLSKMRQPAALNSAMEEALEQDSAVEAKVVEDSEELRLSTIQVLIALAVMSLILLISNWAGTGISPLVALPGMIVIYALSVGGVLLGKVIPIKIPAIAWISLLAIFFGLPFMPTADYLVATTEKLGLLPLITPALAYAGIAISKREVELFKKSGIKIAIVALLTFTGTFLGSAFIADLLL
ncbi:hypothetical protein GCM10007161_03320 [Ignatzschineria indica]|uniref:DUF3100 domain-containing protein n=1 Tax=Ignatzschineria indica TaxID=472583 RepID=A0A2U2AMF3_9GAMM|nr:DUF3100 domain-containing protein [Ignatzschineria indica]PWD84338.1 DUF3100 domain-containing protein [Ignatzschineria indica]GGZ75668.1 hypothetical protein GCM10007161_03320 [Ignatzschineria indica]